MSHCTFTVYWPRVHSISQWWRLCIKGDCCTSWSIHNITSYYCTQRDNFGIRVWNIAAMLPNKILTSFAIEINPRNDFEFFSGFRYENDCFGRWWRGTSWLPVSNKRRIQTLVMGNGNNRWSVNIPFHKTRENATCEQKRIWLDVIISRQWIRLHITCNSWLTHSQMGPQNHHTLQEEGLSSDCFVNSVIIVVYENFSVVLWSENLE